MKHGLVVDIEKVDGTRSTFKFVCYVGLIMNDTMFYVMQSVGNKIKETQIKKEEVKHWTVRRASNFSK